MFSLDGLGRGAAMKWLVVNADDAGLDAAADAAILRCAREGVVRSASVVAGGGTAPAFIEQAQVAGLDLGLHIDLTEGFAVAGPASTLTDEQGRFRGPKTDFWHRAVRQALDPEEVRREVRAQWERLRSLGVTPSHVDGHNHVHVLPAVRAALPSGDPDVWLRVPEDPQRAPASRPPLPAQFDEWARDVSGPWPRMPRFTGFDFSWDPTPEGFLRSVSSGESPVEFMVHPGRRAGSPFTRSGLRDQETRTLCSPVLWRELRIRGWRVTSFRELACVSRS